MAEPHFFKYMKKRHGWHTATLKQIDWQPFKQAARTYTSSDTHLLKLVHDKLPTRSHKARIQSWVDAACPYCGERETFDHIMRCSQAAAKEFRITIIQSVRTYFRKWTAPVAFEETYVEALTLWLDDANPADAHHTIGARQAEIGWSPFIRGFLSIAWRELLETEPWTSPVACSHSESEDSWPPDNQDSSSQVDDWSFYLDEELIPALDPSKEREIDLFLSGLIKLVWSQMSTLWEVHLDNTHHHSTCRTLGCFCGHPAR